jgi:DNA-binding transcriptional MocR family regulator
MDTALTKSDKIVALALGVRMDPEGKGAYPSMRRLARETKSKTGTVAESIKELERRGYLKVVRDDSPGVRKDVNHYLAKCPPRHTCPEGEVCPWGCSKSALEHTELSKSSPDRTRTSAPSRCETCGLGGGHHDSDYDCAKPAEVLA